MQLNYKDMDERNIASTGLAPPRIALIVCHSIHPICLLVSSNHEIIKCNNVDPLRDAKTCMLCIRLD